MRYTFLLFFILTSACSSTDKKMDWTRGAIFYQIFPERFYNGNASNDPSPDKSTPTAKAHRWTSNWYALSDEEKTYSPDFWQNIYRRRYGGDLQGILDKLDYLQSLGITAIYLNPIFEAPSAHKYDATMLHHVDVNFGNAPEEDLKLIAEEDFSNPDTWKWTNADLLFLKLIEEAHKRNIHVVIDGVFNHVGTKFPPFQDVVKHQERSRYKDWFEIVSFEDSTSQEKSLITKAGGDTSRFLNSNAIRSTVLPTRPSNTSLQLPNDGQPQTATLPKALTAGDLMPPMTSRTLSGKNGEHS
jgi:cyclomaltodextrinase